MCIRDSYLTVGRHQLLCPCGSSLGTGCTAGCSGTVGAGALCRGLGLCLSLIHISSYGRRFTADKPTLVATLCTGYADGYPRQLSCGKGIVEILSLIHIWKLRLDTRMSLSLRM